MSDWSNGYNKSEYTFGYYSELNPLNLKLAFINAGCVFPRVGRACELGFGQGVSVNIHASASITEWHGTDFNSSQAGYAREVAASAGTSATLFDDSFAEYFLRDVTGKFDFISLHGIWSWISEKDREIIVQFLRERLNVGGVLYISYNTSPGWSQFIPVRDLMMDHINTGPRSTGMDEGITNALRFADELASVSPRSLISSDTVTTQIQNMKEQDRKYLAHEFFNQSWYPMSFAMAATELSKAKLEFVCSANYLEHIDGVQITDSQRKFLSQIRDPRLKESTKDHMVNQRFRKDYWIRGKRSLSKTEQFRELDNLKMIISTTRANLRESVPTPLGSAKMNKPIYDAICSAMEDFKPITFKELYNRRTMEFPKNQIVQSLMVLCHVGVLHFVQTDDIIESTTPKTRALNRLTMERTAAGHFVGFLASPVTGGGYAVGRAEQLFIIEGLTEASEIKPTAARVWKVLKGQSQVLLKNEAPISGDEDNLKRLNEIGLEFINHRQIILKALAII